jgi:hypothetical protein
MGKKYIYLYDFFLIDDHLMSNSPPGNIIKTIDKKLYIKTTEGVLIVFSDKKNEVLWLKTLAKLK